MPTQPVSARAFASFAGIDLVRWRALQGRNVVPSDPRWGEGRVIDARWEGRSDRPEDPGAVYLRVEYADELRARVNARAFGRLHVTVNIESDMAEFVQRWFDGAGVAESDEESWAEAVRFWDNRLRADQDAERARRIDAVRRRAAERNAQGPVR